jgi:hypothetical protein
MVAILEVVIITIALEDLLCEAAWEAVDRRCRAVDIVTQITDNRLQIGVETLVVAMEAVIVVIVVKAVVIVKADVTVMVDAIVGEMVDETVGEIIAVKEDVTVIVDATEEELENAMIQVITDQTRKYLISFF